MNRLLFTLSILFLSLSFNLSAKDDLPEPMRPYRLVNDFSGIFSSTEKASLEDKLRAYHDQTTTQIYVVTVNSLNGDAAYNYAARLGNKWEIGQKGKDNGVLILIKPKTKDERGDVFIAPGYGLEERLNDAFCGRVIDNQMLPHLRENDYYTATSSAIDTIIERITDKNFTGKEEDILPQDTDSGSSLGFFDCFILIIILVLFIVSPRFRQIIFYLLLLLMRGGGKGGGGRGFGGGGGGRFGGGGAGRSW